MKGHLLLAVFVGLFALLQTVLPVAWAGANQWTSLGFNGSPISVLVIDPTSPSTFYVGTEWGGVFNSTNGGASWNSANTGLANQYIYAIDIDPSNPATLYAGITPGGVFRSTDSGGSWSPINSGFQG